ncbi:RraA family protein [Micromonospora sp. KC723]|uniref:RraA family protein n=1 Tax=Micromonospora sp. KC723 TaxID=2530381 RepID=UPI001FB817C9|nr:RraA family protein [Micromonospora sp. KC723]
MSSAELCRRFASLTTAHVADACLRAGLPVRCAPAAVRPVVPGGRLAGRVTPTRHVGSVDIFLEAVDRAAPGDGLVVDNAGRTDESCVGDLVVREAQAAGLAGVVVWGLHRDTADIRTIGLPVFSLGTIPTGPLRLDPRPPHALARARVGRWTVDDHDLALGDDDGVLFVPTDRGTVRPRRVDPGHRAAAGRTGPRRCLPARAGTVRRVPGPAGGGPDGDVPGASARGRWRDRGVSLSRPR